MNKSFLLTLYIAIIGISTTAVAEEKYYQVDLLMFTRSPQVSSGSELFNRELKPIASDTAIDMAAPVDPRFQLLNPALAATAEAEQKLQQSGKYRVLMHQSWRQPGLSQAIAIPVKITAGQPLDPALFPESTTLETLTPETNYSSIEADTSAPAMGGNSITLDELPLPVESKINIQDTATTAETDGEGVIDLGVEVTDPMMIDANWHPAYEVEGTITIVLERYLHLLTNLNITLADENAPYSTPLRQSHMQAHRKMRSKEFHYVDHPLAGIILYITPTDAPELLPVLETEADILDSQPINSLEEIEHGGQ